MSFTVKATQGGGTNAGTMLVVQVLTGATAAGGNSAASFGSGVLSASFTPTFSNSLIVCGLDNVTGATAFTLASNNSSWNSDPDSTDGFTGAAAFYSGTVTAGTPVTVGATAPTGQTTGYAIYEVPASGGVTPSVDGSSPAAVNGTATSATTAAFTPPAGSVLVAIVACNGTGSAPNTTITMSDTSGLGLTWTQRAATATGGGAFVFTASIPGVPPAVQPHTGGKQWRRLFRHRQQLPLPPAPPVPPPAPAGQQPHGYGSSRRTSGGIWGGAANSPLPSPLGTVPPLIPVFRRKTARAVTAGTTVRTTNAAAGGGVSGSKPGGLVFRRRTARAVFAGLAVAPIIAHPVTGGAVAQRPAEQRPRAVTAHVTSRAFVNGSRPGGTSVYRRAPARAVTGHVAGVAFPNGSRPGGTSVCRRAPARAVTAHITGKAFPNGSQPGGLVRRRTPARALLGNNGQPGDGFTAAAFPNGSRPGGLVARRRPARAVTASITGKAFPNGQRPGGTGVYRRAPARAVTGHVYGPAPALGPAGSPPGGLVIRRQAPGGLWGGLLSSRVFGGVIPPGQAPGGLVRRRAPARAVTAHVAGIAHVNGQAPGGMVARRRPARAVTASILGTARPRGAQPGGLVKRRSTARAVTGHAYGTAQVNGTAPGGLVKRRSPARAFTAGTVVRTINAAPAAPVNGTVQPKATIQPRRTAARAVTGARAQVWGGQAATARPNGTVAPLIAVWQRTRAQVHRVLTAHVTAAAGLNGTPPGGLVRRRSPARAVVAGTVPKAVNALPPAVSAPRMPAPAPRRYPSRVVWRSAAGTVHLLPPLGPGTVLAVDKPVNTAIAADGMTMAVLAADWPNGTVTATDSDP